MRINFIGSLVPGIIVVSILGCGMEELPIAQRTASAPAQDAVTHSEQIPIGADGVEVRNYSDWSEPVNLGSAVNSPSEELTPAISKDGLSLYFSSPRPDVGMVGPDLWVSRRASLESPWGSAQNLGPTINMPVPVADNGAALSIDGHRLFFHSNRPGGVGASDLYVSRRRDKGDDFGWEAPVSLGDAINSSANDVGPAYFEDQDGTASLYFASSRTGGPGGNDIYKSTLGSDGSFGSPVLVAELSSIFDDQRPAIRRDGLEIYIASNRTGTLGALDIWVATRATTSDPWSTPQNIGAPMNTPNVDSSPALSFDATTLYFQSANREGNIGGPRYDIWSTTREKLTGRNQGE